MSDLFVDNIKHQSSQGSGTITLGTSGETIALASGASVTGTGLVGITEADQFRLTATLTGSNGDITSNLERADNATFAKIGTGMTESSGVFTFPSTGLYQVIQSLTMSGTNDSRATVYTYASSDSGSNYDAVTRTDIASSTSATIRATTSSTTFVNVTNTSTFRIKFTTNSFQASSSVIGSTETSISSFTFIRLGDSV